MIYKGVGVVLLISKDRDLKLLFRKVFKKVGKLHLIIGSKITNSPEYPCTKIIFLDISNLNFTTLQSYITNLKETYLGLPIFIITDGQVLKESSRYCPTNFILNHTSFLIVQKPIKEITIKSILFKHMNTLKDRSLDCKKYHGLILDQNQHFAVYNRCKIILTKKETVLLSILIDYSNEEQKVDLSKIKNEILNRENRETSKACIRICIHRIRKKFKEEIGLNIIGNKYGVGYYITI